MKIRSLFLVIILTTLILMITFTEIDQLKVRASDNYITNNDIKNRNYYGRKAMVYYGLLHAKGFWQMDKDIAVTNKGPLLAMSKDSWSNDQAGGGATFKVKGKYVYFSQGDMENIHRPDLIVKINKIIRYVNIHGGKTMLKSITHIGTFKQEDKIFEKTHPNIIYKNNLGDSLYEN